MKKMQAEKTHHPMFSKTCQQKGVSQIIQRSGMVRTEETANFSVYLNLNKSHIRIGIWGVAGRGMSAAGGHHLPRCGHLAKFRMEVTGCASMLEILAGVNIQEIRRSSKQTKSIGQARHCYAL